MQETVVDDASEIFARGRAGDVELARAKRAVDESRELPPVVGAVEVLEEKSFKPSQRHGPMAE